MTIIPGWDVLTTKVPELGRAGGLGRAVLTPVAVFGVALALLLLLDSPDWRWVALLLQLFIYGLTYWLLGGFFGGPRDRRPYSDAFFNRFLPAVGLNIASLSYVLFNNGQTVVEGGKDIILPTSVISFFLFRGVAIYLVASAVVLMARSAQIAGADTLAGVYVYYSDEGRPIQADIYGILRHPVYAGMDRLALAFGLWNGSPYALFLAVLFAAVWHPIWYGLEERELIARFGDTYRTYRETVPAVVPRNLPAGEISMWEALTRRAG